jgi:hypothetical protein
MTVRPGIDAGLEGNNRIQLPAQDHHAPGVLPEMARQVLHAPAQLHVLGDAAVLYVKARVWKVASNVSLVPSTPMLTKFGQAVQRLGIEAQGLASFACRGASAIGNDVGGHRRAEFAIALIDVLNGAFSRSRRWAGQDRYPAIRRALQRESARRANPCPPDRSR